MNDLITAPYRARQLGFDLGLVRFHAENMTVAIRETLGKSYTAHGLEDSEWPWLSQFEPGRSLDVAIFNYFYQSEEPLK